MRFDDVLTTARPWLDHLEAHADVFRREALALTDDDFVVMPDASTYGGSWQACPLLLTQWAEDFPAALLERNRARCPESYALLSRIDGLLVAGILRLAPHSVIKPHEDFRDDDVLRAHLAVQLPPDEQRYWPEGTAKLMDIRARHEAANPTSEPRLTVVVDVRFPYAVPDGIVPPWGPPQDHAA